MFENRKIKTHAERLIKDKKDLQSKVSQQENSYISLKKEMHDLKLQNIELKQDVALHRQSYRSLQEVTYIFITSYLKQATGRSEQQARAVDTRIRVSSRNVVKCPKHASIVHTRTLVTIKIHRIPKYATNEGRKTTV
jgi:hypothetical protein